MKRYKNIWTIYLFNPRSKKYIPYWQVFSESNLKKAVKHLKRSGYRFRVRKKKVSLERYRERKQELKQLFIPKKRI
jgi:hypothetical protein